ncbi:hypothetical protein [Flagellimonas olearia]|uniref:Uncharacterized protein n=1 Tax=Flagellimonas olearia TaxID=552546 RepID=A0A444VM99_9FLAO|nr:hypothetical protein [Allomuricauda olearia]RYC51832.1 hypothetical protein DN53_08055 [Allomuricauda olearia]
MLETHKHIYEFCNELSFDLRGDYIEFRYNDGLIKYLQNNGISFETIRDQSIQITYQDLGFLIFQKPVGYLTIPNVRKELDILILSSDDVPLSFISNQTYLNFEQNKKFYFFSNAKHYVEFIDFLESKDQETEDAFHFIDYANGVNRKIVLTSITEKSRIILKFFKEIQDIPNDKDFSKGLNLFKNCFLQDNFNLPKFLKSSLIKFASRYDYDNRLNLVFQNLREIVDDAKMNFEIYINNLSIDKIRKDYDDYKSKYFSEVSDILKKVSQQIIGFPIVAASTLFAIEKVKSNEIFLWILAFVILVTTIYLILLLRMNFRDLKYVDQLSEKDFQSIKNNNFFIKFPDELTIFNQIKVRITTRIKNLKIVCESYFWILSVANTVLICLMLYYLKIPAGAITFIGLLILFLMIIARNKIWEEKSVV